MASSFMRPPPGDLAAIAREEPMSASLQPAPLARSAQANAGQSVVRRLREAAHARTVRLEPRKRVLVTHLAIVTLTSVAALVSVLAR